MDGQSSMLSQIQHTFGEGKLKPGQYSALALAYIGDGVYDLIIRSIVVGSGNHKVKEMHQRTSSIVKAETQSKIMKSLEDMLTDEEMAIFHHGRNAKSGSSSKNASIVDYRIATGFEALIGYLYLDGKMERVMELVKSGLDRNGIIL